jgi:hypothetical protein
MSTLRPVSRELPPGESAPGVLSSRTKWLAGGAGVVVSFGIAATANGAAEHDGVAVMIGLVLLVVAGTLALLAYSTSSP